MNDLIWPALLHSAYIGALYIVLIGLMIYGIYCVAHYAGKVFDDRKDAVSYVKAGMGLLLFVVCLHAARVLGHMS